MSSNPFNKPLYLTVKPSLQKVLMIVIPHFCVLLLALLIPHFHLALRLTIIAVIALSIVYVLRLHIYFQLKKSVIAVKQDSAKNWSIQTKQTDYISVDLLPSSFVNNTLIILNFIKDNGSFLNKKYTVIFTTDSLTKDEYRRLKVRLKMNSPVKIKNN